jgi:hypothetical protein
MRVLALRLRPKQDLKLALHAFATQEGLQAGFILSGIGSLYRAAIRLADQADPTVYTGKFEITSLAGTLAVSGTHLHMAIANPKGHTIGGHLAEGCLIYTTAEIVIGEATQLRFGRELDQETGFQELVVQDRYPRLSLSVSSGYRLMDCSD